MTENEIYDSHEEALRATDEFYRAQSGFNYDMTKITNWLSTHVRIPKKGRVLDLCCGDGIWSLGLKMLNPDLELYGIDISSGGIERAQSRLDADKENFVIRDVEGKLPFDKNQFQLIFARGAGLFNQRDMTRDATVATIEMWHEYLSDTGQFYGIYGSTPKLMGSYTPMDKVKLPLNRAPHKSEIVNFEGGKFHHTISSFHAPFWAAPSLEVVNYKFVTNKHVILTRRKKDT